jgi:hypothetical protein
MRGPTDSHCVPVFRIHQCQNDAGGGEGDHMGNMSSAATIFLVLSIVIGVVFGMSTYAIAAGALMLILVAIVHFTGILPE